MKIYTSKEELKDEIRKTYAKFIAEFQNIPESMKDLHAEGVDRSPSENLAYHIGWTSLILKWEEDEMMGREAKTPSDQFRWNQLGALYQWFTDVYADHSLDELKVMLDKNIRKILDLIDSLSDEELFTPHRRKWADSATRTAKWEVYKFIHINTVAPFGTFRTKIRKWKKAML